jgi:GrpB-like predicted nucleotidyltransferase (UPF0157 family)
VDETLRTRLADVGLDPDDVGDPGEAFARLHERFGRRATLVDRYALEAAARGVETDELDRELRAQLALEVIPMQFPGWEVVPAAARTASDPVEVVPYRQEWAATFTAWSERLSAALGATAARIEHVGATAVRGLAAKPVVDIQVSVRDLEDEDEYVPAIEDLDVALRSREPDRRYFRPSGDRPRTVQIHVCRVDSPWEREHLLFRDFLRADARTRDAYGRLKLELARRYADDRLAYTDAKTGFILDALDEAERWARRVGWGLPPLTRR